VPQERVRVIEDSKVVSRLKKSLGVKISFLDNSVSIEGEGLELYQAKTIVKAMGRGFSPEKAYRLLEENDVLEIIELGQFNDNKIRLIKSRLIGTQGKAWRMIEKFSGCSMSVYGKTVALIGTYEQLNIAKEAVQMIIRGSKHSKVYGFLFQSQA
jgi:ribosomal RNA assembly protein